MNANDYSGLIHHSEATTVRFLRGSLLACIVQRRAPCAIQCEVRAYHQTFAASTAADRRCRCSCMAPATQPAIRIACEK